MDSLLVYAVARLAMAFFRLVPRPVGRGILNVLAFLAFYLDARHRRIADINLQIAFPEMSRMQRNQVARRSFQITAQNLLEVSRLSALTKDSIRSLVEYDRSSGWNNFEAAKARKKPILYLTGHFSAWELLPAAHALYGNPLSFVTRPLDNARLERHLFVARQASGNTVISKKNSVRHILETLKACGSVGILMDQNTDPQEGIFVDFFGLPAATTTGVALFALRSDATVLPGYLTPMRAGRYYIKFLPPLELLRSGDRNRDVEENTRIFNQVLEDIIRDQPESWLWGHKRWHYQPGECPGDIYRLSDTALRALLQSKRKDTNRAPERESAHGTHS